MVSGTYRAQVNTPIGTKEGTLKLEEHDGALSGLLYVLGGDAPIQNGVVDADGNLSFSGTLQVPFIGALPFTFEGTHEGDSISGTAVTKMGAIGVSGSRV